MEAGGTGAGREIALDPSCQSTVAVRRQTAQDLAATVDHFDTSAAETNEGAAATWIRGPSWTRWATR